MQSSYSPNKEMSALRCSEDAFETKSVINVGRMDVSGIFDGSGKPGENTPQEAGYELHLIL